MPSWTLVPCLTTLRNEFNLAYPGRDRASDGSVGDLAHQDSSSDHNPDETGSTPYEDADSTNEVHAIDIDKDLKGPGTSKTVMREKINVIVLRHRNGLDDRLQNIIYDGHIISRSWGWREWRTYSGPNKHTQHAHFSARYTTAQERDTKPWGVYFKPEPPRDWSDMATQGEVKAAAKDAFWEVLNSPEYAALHKKLSGQGTHNQVLGSGTTTIGQVLQPLPSLLGTLLAYATAEAGEVPPTAQENAAAVVAALEPVPTETPDA